MAIQSVARFGRPSGALTGSVATALGGQGALVVSGVLAARMLGPEQRGYLALAVFLPAVLAQVASLGTPQAITYFVARDGQVARAIFRRVVPLAAVQAVVAVAIHIALLPTFFGGSPAEVWGVALAALVVAPAGLMQQYGLALLQGQRHFLAFNALRILPASMYGIAVAALFFADAGDLSRVAGAWIAVQVGIGAATLLVAVRATAPTSAAAPPLRRIVRFGLDGFLGSASPVETFRLDQALIGLFLTPVALGLYVVGLSLTNLPRFVAQSVGMVAYPRIAADGDPTRARRAMWRFTWLTVGLCALVVVPLWVAAGALVPFFFGEGFKDSVVLTRLLLAGSLLWAARRVLSDGTRGLGLPRLGSIAEVASWFVLALALAVLMPAWGVEGVAVALVLSSASSLAVLLALTVLSERHRARRGRAGGQTPAFHEERAATSATRGEGRSSA